MNKKVLKLIEQDIVGDKSKGRGSYGMEYWEIEEIVTEAGEVQRESCLAILSAPCTPVVYLSWDSLVIPDGAVYFPLSIFRYLCLLHESRKPDKAKIVIHG